MTDAHEANDLDGPHEGPIKTPRQLILAVFWAFVVPIFGIVLLVVFVGTSFRPSAGSDAFTTAAVDARIRPVGILEVKDVTDVASMKGGEAVYTAQCAACHASGALNAPKLGDTAAWSARIRQGYDALLKAAIGGKGQMPPQGGGDHTDFEIGRAVVYMANKAGATFAEPAMPAMAASGAASGAAPAMAATTVATTAATAGAATGPAGTTNAGTPTPALSPPGVAPTAPAPAVAAAPAAATTTTTAAAAAPPALYGQICAACHIAGVAGAPKLGDKAAWAPRLALGIDGLTASVVKGKGAMPPKGGSAASEAEIKAVVTYMVNASK